MSKSATRIKSTLALMTPKPLALDQNGRAALIAGYWRIFERLDSSQQSQVYLDASQRKDDLVLAAFDLWPDFDPKRTIDANSVAQGRYLRQQAENVDAARELRELQDLDAQLRTAIASVESEIGVPDAIQIAATGLLVDQGGPRRSNGAATTGATA